MSPITLDKLFRAFKPVELPNGETVIVRALSDAERKTKQMATLRAAIRLDQRLDDPESDEYLVYITPVAQLPREELEEIVVEWQKNDLARAAFEQYKNEYLPFPDDATDEEMKDVLGKRKESEAATEQARKDYVKREAKVFAKKVQGWTDEVLLKEAVRRKKFAVSIGERFSEDVYQTIFLGTEKDGHRYFSSMDEVRSMHTDVLNRLLESQREVDSLDIWELTKTGDGRHPERVVDTQQDESESP